MTISVILKDMSRTLTDYDPWLEPYTSKIRSRQLEIESKITKALAGQTVADFARGFEHFGLHLTKTGWVFHEWAPNANRVVLVGDFSNWNELPDYTFAAGEQGQWSLHLPAESLEHGQSFKLRIYWPGGSGWRLPSYATYVVQDPRTHDFSAVIWHPDQPYIWRNTPPTAPDVPLIYEAHVGMSAEKAGVASYSDFSKHVLPRIKQSGYNTVQLMAIAEHPYYGSFGYHVTNYFAASSRFGTPDELKELIDTAHGLGLRVILDLVHSHSARNEAEGLSRFDGQDDLYFHPGQKGEHPAWDSRLFDYGKPEVLHFLLSNCRWWLDEYHVDGFRFDGVTSLIYHHHGLDKAFTNYDDYYDGSVDVDALVYLKLVNDLVHEINPDGMTIAEEMSGLPGLAAPSRHGGLGFDYRLNMGGPDLWIKTLKEQRDEDWNLGELIHSLMSHRPEEKTINYAESHDQALVGDKTLIFRLIDQAMYWHMQKSDENLIVERGIALHKMIRLLTASTHSGGYLNFMGNEFGHPEWIDFPREGNEWSYTHARRQWSLADNPDLKYHWLQDFDRAMVALIARISDCKYHYLSIDNDRRIVSFFREDYLMVFNFSPQTSYEHHNIATFDGDYKVVLSSDSQAYGGQERVDTSLNYQAKNESIPLYLPSRTALVLRKQ